MKKLYTLLCLFFCSVLGVTAQFQYNQFFDGADTSYQNSIIVKIDTTNPANIWQIGKPQKIFFSAASTLPNAIVTDTLHNYPPNNHSSFEIKTVNQFFWGILAVTWMQKLDMDTITDGATIEFSTDGGSTWQNSFNNPLVYNFYGYSPGNVDTLSNGQVGFTGSDTTWRNIWLCFDISWMSTFPDTVRFRFSFTSDSINNSKEGWMIDNMMNNLTIIHTAKSVKQTNYLNVYPNPSGNIVHIEAAKLEDFHIIEHMELINAQGTTVESWRNLPTKYWFDTKKYSDGNYTLHIKTNVNEASIPLIICKD